MEAMVHRLNIHYSEILKYVKRKSEKRIYDFLCNYNYEVHGSTFHFVGWSRYIRHRYSTKLFNN